MIDFRFGVTLGPIERRFLESMRAWRNDYSTWRWCRQNDLISDVDQEKWLERISQDPTIKMYLIWSDSKTQPVGVCGLTSIDRVNQRAEFSLYVAPESRGLGFGKMGLKTLLSHGFKNQNLHCIWGETFDGNPAEQIFKELGFQFEGSRRDFYFRNGRFIGAHLYSMLSTEWKCST